MLPVIILCGVFVTLWFNCIIAPPAGLLQYDSCQSENVQKQITVLYL